MNSLEKEDLIDKLIKLEDQNEQSQKVISILDERAGPAVLFSRSESNATSTSISPVTHEIEQVDPEFASNFRYTTDVSHMLPHNM